MIKGIKKFFEDHLDTQSTAAADDVDHRLRLATAALLIEMTRADDEIKDAERDSVTHAVQTNFELSDSETEELVALAEQEASQAVCYHEFTSLINNEYSNEQKLKIVELMWQVAFADEEMDKHEEALVRKIAELLYVPHKDFIAAKHRVRQRIGGSS